MYISKRGIEGVGEKKKKKKGPGLTLTTINYLLFWSLCMIQNALQLEQSAVPLGFLLNCCTTDFVQAEGREGVGMNETTSKKQAKPTTAISCDLSLEETGSIW